MRYLLLITTLLIISCGNKAEEKKTNTKTSKPLTALEKSVQRGKEVYSANCVSCHLNSGKGVPGAFPPLNTSDWLINKRIESIHAVKYGLNGPIKVNGKSYDNVMSPLGLDDKEVADVMNYTIQTWNTGAMVTVKEVAAAKK